MTAAAENKRSLNGEIMLRLHSTLRRDRDSHRQRHIKALSEMIELAALGIERSTERRFTEDRYTAEQLVKALDLLLWQYSPKTEAVPPPAVVAAAKTLGDPSQLGVIEAGTVIALLDGRLGPPGTEDLRLWPPNNYPESMWGLWQVRNDLKPRKRK
jgi:hypothetical protein